MVKHHDVYVGCYMFACKSFVALSKAHEQSYPLFALIVQTLLESDDRNIVHDNQVFTFKCKPCTSSDVGVLDDITE